MATEQVATEQDLLTKAQAGDIRAFHTLFSEFQPQLKSYLYRLVANRNDMEDLAQDVFILAFEGIKGFRGEATLKSWVFTIATNCARRHLKQRQRWATDTFERTKQLAHGDERVMETLHHAHQHGPQGRYEIREHIDYCFTCVSKMLPLKQQIALILKDIYGFKIREVATILGVSQGVVKHLLHNARNTMLGIFDDTCALVSKRGVCDQCTELNGLFNPKQDKQAETMKIKWVKNRDKHTTKELLRLRMALVRGVDPLFAEGADLHEAFLQINQRLNRGEVAPERSQEA